MLYSYFCVTGIANPMIEPVGRQLSRVHLTYFLGMVRISVYRSNHKYAVVVIYGIALASTLNYSLCFAHF